MLKIIITLLLIIGSECLYAQPTYLIQNVKVFDGQKVIDNTSVLIGNGKILRLSDSIKIASHYIRIEGHNKTLMPALANAHVHAFNPASFQEAARAGVLNLFDLAGYGPFQKMMNQEFKDSIDYANHHFTGAPATAPKGHGTQFKYPVSPISTVDEAKRFIASKKSFRSNYIKIIVEPSRPTLSKKLVQELIRETHKINKIAVVHISKSRDAYEMLKMGANGLAHLWRDTLISEEKLDEIAQLDSVFIIPTLITNVKAINYLKDKNPDANVISPLQLKHELNRIYKKGIAILAGTDPPNLGINYGTDLYEELKLFSEAGMSNLDILKSVTSNIMNAFAINNKGYVKEGFDADLILINGNPLDNIEEISNIEHIWKAGQLVTND